MKKLLFLTVLLSFVLFSCTKKDEPLPTQKLVTFSFKVKGFTMQTVPFKALNEDSIFNTFHHIYGTLQDIEFTDANGKHYDNPIINANENPTIETYKFQLPVGTYTITGVDGVQNLNVSSFMMAGIDVQTVIITETTTTIPITLRPDCFLLLVADPYHAVDRSSDATNVELYFYHTSKYVPLLNVKTNDNTLQYLYCYSSGYEYFGFTKIDGTVVKLDPLSSYFKMGYAYRIFVTKAGSKNFTSIVNSGFISTDIQHY